MTWNFDSISNSQISAVHRKNFRYHQKSPTHRKRLICNQRLVFLQKRLENPWQNDFLNFFVDQCNCLYVSRDNRSWLFSLRRNSLIQLLTQVVNSGISLNCVQSEIIEWMLARYLVLSTRTKLWPLSGRVTIIFLFIFTLKSKAYTRLNIFL